MKRTERQKQVLAMSKQLEDIDVFETFGDDVYDLDLDLLDYYSYNSCKAYSVAREATENWKTYLLNDVYNGQNVGRYFNVVCHKRSLNAMPKFRWKEVAQDWSEGKERVVLKMLPKDSKDFFEYYIDWNFRTKMIPRNDFVLPDHNNNFCVAYSDRYLIHNLGKFSRASKEVYAITNNVDHIRAIEFNHSVQGYIAEYFAKTGKLELVDRYVTSPYRYNEYFDTLKIAYRHNYKIEDISEYFDYLQLLNKLKLDLKNPHYICPSDFSAEMEKYKTMVDRKRAIEAERRRREDDERRRREAEKALQDAIKANEKYISEHKDYLAIEFMSSDKSIKFHVLQNVPEFLEEGTEMKHCVYRMGYFNKKDSIILSARNAKTNERLATVEISLKTYKILQCYAYDDKISKQDEKIRNAVNKNIELFKINKAS